MKSEDVELDKTLSDEDAGLSSLECEENSAASDSQSSSCTEDEKEEDAAVEDEEDEAVDKEIAELETVLSQNSRSGFTYEKHLRLLRLLRSQGELEHLRAARQRLCNSFPLTPALWLEWIGDERQLLDDDTERHRISALYRKAVQDYLSVDLWLEFCMFSSGTIIENPDEFRTVVEEALVAVGAHPSAGHLIWEVYRDVEILLLNSLQENVTEAATECAQVALEQQRNRINKLFSRQLAVPHVSMESTWKDYVKWSVEPDANTQRAYQQACTIVQKLMPFEAELSSLGEDAALTLAAYERYLDFELSSDEQPARLVCLFERVLAECRSSTPFCLYPHLWLRYADYLEAKPGFGEATQRLYARAVRNTPWCAELWLRYALLMESRASPYKEVHQLYEDALQAGFAQSSDYLQVWLSYADFVQRGERSRLPTTEEAQDESFVQLVERAIRHMDAFFGTFGDRDCLLHQYWAEIEARAGRFEKARELWNELQRRDNVTRAHVWLQRLEWERRWVQQQSMGGEEEAVKSNLKRLILQALNSVKDDPEAVFAWSLRFVREECSLLDVVDVRKRIDAQRKRVAQQLQKMEAKAAQVDKQVNDAALEQQRRGKKRGAVEQEHEDEGASTRKVLQFDEKKKAKVADDRTNESSTSSKSQKKFASRQVPLDEEKAASDQSATASSKLSRSQAATARVEHDPSKDHRTAFLSNLDFGAEDAALRDFLKECGELVEIRIARDFRGRSKGFAYAEFVHDESVSAALALDRKPLLGRPVFVSPCDAQRRTAAPLNFPYKLAGLEPHKLFVRNLPRGMTREAIQVMFGAYGSVRDVRLATLRNGTPKGHAYVEFETAADASRALVATDQLLVGENRIEVQISNPPERSHPTAQQQQQPLLINKAAVLGGGASGGGPRTHPNFRMLPRALSARSKLEEPQENTNVLPTIAPKTNEQFRELLLAKK